jgi:chromosome segregation ATPase
MSFALQPASLLALAACIAFAQAQDSGKTGNTTQSASTANSAAPSAQEKKELDETKTKKVWTNDDVSQLKGVISVVGEAPAPQDQAADAEDDDKSNRNTHQAMVRHYRDAIADLKAQITNADAFIAKLKGSRGEDSSPSGGVDPRRLAFTSPPEEQVKQLETKKKELQAKIEDLEAEATKEGIEPGELR